MKILSNNTVRLCPCNPNSYCPEVTMLDNGCIQITDDFDGIVKMTLEEAKEIVEALKFIENGDK
jgi:hypothetical protein